MGTLILKNKNKIISETDLIVGKDIKKPNIFKQYLSVVRDIFSGSVY